MGLKGVDDGYTQPLQRSAFRSSWTQPEGAIGAFIHEARVLDLNLINWTVDCITIFDQKRFFDIQVASPYLHARAGEGIYAMPEVGAKCLVCIPSDGPPPFVLAFIMPPETLTNTASEDAPFGTSPAPSALANTQPSGSTYAGGRVKTKPGDIVLKGHDGNFCVLHRGGVLQIGSTELAQRIYIPLTNLVTDISQNYNHFNSGGAINWGMRTSSDDQNPETEYKSSFRVFANDEFADVRVAVGKIHVPTQEPTGDAGSTSDLEQLEIGTDEIIVYEVSLAPGGFDTDASLPVQNIRELTKLRFFFDRGGNAMLRAEGAVSLRIKKKLRIRVDDDIEVFGKGRFLLDVDGSLDIVAGSSLNISTSGGVIKLNGGSKPVATVGSIVRVTVTAPVPITTSSGPGTISAGAILTGIVASGNPTLLA